MKGKVESEFENVIRRSGVDRGRVRRGVAFLVSPELQQCVME